MADIWSEFKKYLGDALPGGALNPELTTNINESPVPVGMAALRSFLGEAPDELGVSVLHPQRAAIMRAANPAFAVGTALGVAPVLGGLSALKASAPSIASGSKTAQRGAIYWGYPEGSKGHLQRMARMAREADPKNASIEFALTGVTPKIVKGVERSVPSELLDYAPHPTYGWKPRNVHTHGFDEMSLPSFEDLAEWRNKPPQSGLGVVKLKPEGGYSSVIADFKETSIPTEKDIFNAQREAVKTYGFQPDVEDFEYDLGKWKWLLDKAKKNDIDLYLKGIEPPKVLFPKGLASLRGYDPYEVDRAVHKIKPMPELKPAGTYAGYDILQSEEPFRVYHGTSKPWSSDQFKPLNHTDEYGDKIGQNLGDVVGPHATLDTGLATSFSRGFDPEYGEFLSRPKPGSNIRAYQPRRIVDLSALPGDDDHKVLNEAIFKIAGSDLNPEDVYKLPYEVKKKIVADAVHNAEAHGIDALRYTNTGHELTYLPEYAGGRTYSDVGEKSFMLFPHVKVGFKRGGLAQMKECSCGR